MEKYTRKERIFISYSKSDKTLAEEICNKLERKNISCWIAPRNIDVSEKWANQIVHAIEECLAFIIVIGEKSMQSDEILKELTLASEMKKRIFAICVNGCEPVRGFKYHLSIAQRLNLYSGMIDEVIQSIVEKTTGNSKREVPVSVMDVRQDSKQGDEEVQIVTYQELTRHRGLDKTEIARQLVANDRKLYPHIDDDNEGDVSQWETYLSKYPQTFRYMVNSRNEIVGNWSMVAISSEDYRRAKNGELLESQINIGNTAYFMFGGVFYGYLLNLSVNEDEMSPENIRRLFDSFLEQLEDFAEKDIYFKNWCVNVFLEDHEKRYETLGFTYVSDNIKTGKIYTLDLWPYPKNSIFKKRKRLKKLYEEKFKVTCRQLESDDLLDEDELETIAGLIYDTDPYIYPALFGTRENALQLLPELIENKDAMFKQDNFFIAENEDEIVGLILWVKGSLNWSKQAFMEMAQNSGVYICEEHVKQVDEKYIASYEDVEDQECISIINICVVEEKRGIGIGKQMIEQFIRKHRSETMELCVLEDNLGAVRLYENEGFREIERYPGFSIDKEELVCIGMKREN